ncbi:MAG: PhnD/SsuA/transferrin family substrate-binding protein [Rhodospirillales bacterium]|nr:PhnD/SsuA/transferrin family substrate-binding protein [Alphaproteobacteria bacterium]MBL6948578.1 PhnD/SsuA/transferrin family substrate-binding protein [Rhodospirillales bacterium]
MAELASAAETAKGPAEAAPVRIGVLAFRGTEHAVRSWMPMARYLTARIAGKRFEIVPLPLADLRQATKKGAIDYVFTNPGQYVELEEAVGISRILTLKKAITGGISNVFGAVIFVRAERSDLKTLGDLKGKVFAAVSPGAFGGFQMAWREFKSAGIDPFKDFKDLRFMGFPQDDIVFAVRDGHVDAATVRTDILETMEDEDKITLENYRILNPRLRNGMPMRVSTRLYPEWPLAAMPHMPSELSEQMALALMSLKSDSPEMLASGYTGWTVPLDYKPVHDLFRDLELGPYARGDIGILDILRRHWEWVVFTSVILFLIILHGIRTEYLVQHRTRELSGVNRELEHQIQERLHAEDQVRQHEAELAHVSRVSVIGEMTSGLAHELRQPLSAIRNYAEGGIRRLERKNGDRTGLEEALTQIAEQASRAGQIIARVRGYMRKREPRREAVDMNRAVEEAVTLFQHDARNTGIEIQMKLAPGLPTVMGDMIEIEQMIINLGRNAIDAMVDAPDDGGDWRGDQERGKGRLEISTTNVESGVMVRVSDTGPGLTDEEMDTVWQPFVTTKESGLGLGLAICRSIAEAHGGRIWAEPAPIGGLSVAFFIPAGDEEEAADHAA